VEATVRPAASVMLIGNMLLHLKGSGIFSCFMSAIRGSTAPFGLLMVMSTPVISGAGGSNARMRLALPTSDLNTLYVFQWVLLHFVGFVCFIGPTIMLELPVAVIDLFKPPQPGPGETWSWIAKMLWYGMTVLRIVCPILMLRAAPNMFADQAKNPNTLRAKKWYGEYCVGELGASVMYFNAISVLLLPGQGPYNLLDIMVVGAMLLESLRLLFFYGIWSLMLLHAWDDVDFKYECMARSTMSRGPVMKGLRQITGSQLVFLHAVQAGHYDPTEWHVTSSPLPTWMVNGALGVAQGPVRQFIIRPEMYADFNAFDFLDMSLEDLSHFTQDLLSVLKGLPSSSTLFFPFGDLYKKGVRRPFLSISCVDFDEEVRRLEGPKANTAFPNCSEQDEVALDVTDFVFGMVKCPQAFKEKSFIEALAEEDAAEILAVFGQLINEGGYKEKERPDLGPHYEVQVREIRASRPLIVLRTCKTEKLPEGWMSLPQLGLLPTELTGSESKKGK